MTAKLTAGRLDHLRAVAAAGMRMPGAAERRQVLVHPDELAALIDGQVENVVELVRTALAGECWCQDAGCVHDQVRLEHDRALAEVRKADAARIAELEATDLGTALDRAVQAERERDALAKDRDALQTTVSRQCVERDLYLKCLDDIATVLGDTGEWSFQHERSAEVLEMVRKVAAERDALAAKLAAATTPDPKTGASVALLRVRNWSLRQDLLQVRRVVRLAKLARGIEALNVEGLFAELERITADERARPARCDGDHGEPACSDPQCWHGEGDEQTRAFPAEEVARG